MLVLLVILFTISVNNSNLTSVFLKTACYANPGAERCFRGSK